MQELYNDIRPEVKEIAKTSWMLAAAQINPVKASDFLDNVTNYYRNILTEKEVEFLQFYFNLQLEMMKE